MASDIQREWSRGGSERAHLWRVRLLLTSCACIYFLALCCLVHSMTPFHKAKAINGIISSVVTEIGGVWLNFERGARKEAPGNGLKLPRGR